MKKQVNVRLVVITFLTLVVLGVGTHFLHAYQVERNAHSLLDRSAAAEKTGQLDEAVRYLSLYMGLRPDDNESLAKLGTLLADERMSNSGAAKFRALQILNKVLTREPDRHDLRRIVVRLSLDVGRYSDAREDIKNLLNTFKDDGELELMLARCYERTAEYASAREYYEKSILHAPTTIDAYARLAGLLRTKEPSALWKDSPPDRAEVYGDADKTIEKMILANPKAYRAYLARAGYRRAFLLKGDKDKKDKAQAEINADIAKAHELAGDELDVILAAAESAREQGRKDEARQILRRGRDLHPQDWRVYVTLARLDAAAGDRQAALASLKQGLERIPKQPDLLWELAENQIALDLKADANATIALLGEVGVPPSFRDCLTAQLDIADERWADAARRLETAFFGMIDPKNQQTDRMTSALAQRYGLMLGDCYEKLGDSERALRAYSRVNVRDPQSIPALLGMARNSFALWRLQDAIDQYGQVLRLPGAPVGALVEVVRLMFLRNLERPPGQQNWPEVETALAAARKALESQNPPLALPELPVLEAEILAAQKKFQEAKQVIATRFGDVKNRPLPAWISLSGIEISQGRVAEGLKILDETQAQLGDSVDWRVARSRALAATKTPDGKSDPASRPAIARLAQNRDGFSVNDRIRLLRGLASSSMQAGDAAGAVGLLEQLAAMRPSDVTSRMTLFDLAAETGDLEAMQKWQSEIKKIEGDEGVMWRYVRARYLIEQARRGDKSGLAEARVQLAAVAAQRPEWSRVPMSEALIDDLSGQTDRALNNYLRARRMGANEPFALIRAAELLYFQGRYAEANDLFSTMPAEALPLSVQQAAADAALQAGKSSQALSLAQAAVPSDSTDFRRQMWLGWMYWKANETEKAKAAFQRSRDLAKDNPDPWVALVLFLANTNQKDAAVAELEAAERQLKGPASVVALANCNAAVGRNERAATLFRDALAARPDDPNALRGAAEFCVRTGKLAEAQAHLKNLMEVSRVSAPETYATARRTLAYLLTMEGDPEKSREALALFDAAADGASADSSQDRRTRAQLLALRNTRDSHRTAIQLLEDLISQNQATTEDYFLAAQLLEANGDWAKARKRLAHLLKDSTDSTAPQWAAAARSFLRHNELAEADVALKKLEKNSPDIPLTREIQARVLHAQGKTADAVAILMEIAKAPDTDLSAIGFILAEFGDQAAAESMLRRYVAQSKKPESVFALIRYFTEQKRPLEALELCDRAWENCPDLAVADACLGALGQLESNSSAFQRVETQLKTALGKNPKSVELQVALATIRSLQGRYDDAIAQYRRVLEKNPKNPAALNNLAWLLALSGTQAHEALKMAELAVEVSNQNLGMIDTRAVCALVYGAPDAVERAIRDLETITAQSPSATTYFHLAQAYKKAERGRDAMLAWQRATALGLSPKDLHPLERPAYEKLMKDLGKTPSAQ